MIGAAPPLTPALPFTAKNGFLKETINSATAPFQHSNDTSDNFSTFSGLVLGFGLFQLNP